MTDLSADFGLSGNRRIGKAVYQHPPLSKDGMSERLFALLFSGLVYPQIWEDPEVDMEAMELSSGHSIVAIASGGCNMMAYLTRSPGRVDVVDLNAAHVALNRLKLAAVRHLPSHGDLFRFFGSAGNVHNGQAYDRFVAPHLDASTRRFWERRDWRGRRAITVFERDFYRTGLLGFCIAMAHAVSRLHGVDPAGIMASRNAREQRLFFEESLSPLFDKPLVRWATSKKASLFGLGIPPAQYDSLITDGDGTMASVLRARLEKLACHFPLADNYFAWQAFARRYPRPGEAALPLWLAEENFAILRANADRARVHHANLVELLATKPAGSVDRFVLLDAQDWMTDAQLESLWNEITRTAAPGARVVFRTAAAPTLLPGRVSRAILGQWRYEEGRSAMLGAKDRSAIYGGFHLYVRQA